MNIVITDRGEARGNDYVEYREQWPSMEEIYNMIGREEIFIIKPPLLSRAIAGVLADNQGLLRKATFIFYCFQPDLIVHLERSTVPTMMISGSKYAAIVDKLEDMYMRNKKFTDFVRPEMNQQEWIDKNYIETTAELIEFMNETSWKWWGRGLDDIDIEKAEFELADTFHFLFNLCEAIGMDADKIYKRYCEKNDENWERQKKKTGFGKNVDR